MRSWPSDVDRCAAGGGSRAGWLARECRRPQSRPTSRSTPSRSMASRGAGGVDHHRERALHGRGGRRSSFKTVGRALPRDRARSSLELRSRRAARTRGVEEVFASAGSAEPRHSGPRCAPRARAPGGHASIRPRTSSPCRIRAARPGCSKGVMLTHRNLVANLLPDTSAASIQHRRRPRLAVLPFFHIDGMVVIMNAALLARRHDRDHAAVRIRQIPARCSRTTPSPR